MRIGSPAVTFVYHLGLHSTDENLLIRSLMKNGDDLNKQKIILPRPRRYRSLIADITKKYRGDPMPDSEQQELFDKLTMDYPTERIMFGNDNFICKVQAIFERNKLYGGIGEKAAWLRYLFPENPCEFFLAIRNPATFVPAAMRAAGTRDYGGFTKGVDPRTMRWSNVIAELQAENPDCPITVWCNEDTPLVWPTILREFSDAGPEFPLHGEMDVLQSIMTEDGFKRMQSYLESHSPPNEIQRRRVFAAFLDKFAIEDELEEDIDLPGWTPAFVDEITNNYDDDVYEIERMSGVNFITT